MERKFASKLSQLKPAAEARVLASHQLKESIELNKSKHQIEPIDYDSYVEENRVNLSNDLCSRQIILLPSDDVYIDETKSDNIDLNGSSLSLLLHDALETYAHQRCEVKYKYHAYGGNYRQLPDFAESSAKAKASLGSLIYEIDSVSAVVAAAKKSSTSTQVPRPNE